MTINAETIRAALGTLAQNATIKFRPATGPMHRGLSRVASFSVSIPLDTTNPDHTWSYQATAYLKKAGFRAGPYNGSVTVLA